MTTPKYARVMWVDYAKGIGIFLVVLGHTFRGLHASRIIADSPLFDSVDSWIYRFHMPLFMLLAGLWAERRVGRSFGVFVREQLATLAYPYLIWSLLQTFLQFAFSHHTNQKPRLQDLTGILIYPIMQFWFLYALFVISLIYYILRRCRFGPVGVLSVFGVFWTSQQWMVEIPWAPLAAARNLGVYYALGAVLNSHGRNERIERAPTTVLALTVLLGYGVVTVWASHPLAQTLPMALAVTLCGIAASMALGVLLSRAAGLNFVRVLGVYSLEIYVAHTAASAALRIALQNLLKVRDVTAHVVIGTVGGLVLPVVLGMLCHRYHTEFLFRFPRPATNFRSISDVLHIRRLRGMGKR